MAVVVNKVYCNVIVLRIVPHVREPGFRNGEKFCSGIRNTAQEIWNPTNLFIPLLNSRSVDHLNQLQVVQHWRLFHSKVVWDKCVKSVGRIKNGIRASTI